MSKGLRWDFHFTPLRDADSISSGSSRAWGDLSNNIDGLTKKMQKWASDPNDEYFKKEFSKLSPEEQLNVMQRGDFIPEEYAKRVSPEMRDKYRLNNPEQSMIWQNQLAQMQQQKQNAEMQRYGFDRTKLTDNRADAEFNYKRDAYALQRKWEDAVASGNPNYQQQVRNEFLDWNQQYLNQNPNLPALKVPAHREGLAELNAHQKAENEWNSTLQNQRVDALVPEIVQLLGDAAPDSDAANVVLERLQASSTPQEWHDITLALQKLTTSGLTSYTVPSLMAQANNIEDAENAALIGGSPTGGIPIESKGVSSGTDAFSHMASEGTNALALRPLTEKPIAFNDNNVNLNTNNFPTRRDGRSAIFKGMEDRDAAVERQKNLRNESKIEKEWEAINKREAQEVAAWNGINKELHTMLENPAKTRTQSVSRNEILGLIKEHEKHKPASLKGEALKNRILEDIEKYKQDGTRALPIDIEWDKASHDYAGQGGKDKSQVADQMSKVGMPLLADNVVSGIENETPVAEPLVEKNTTPPIAAILDFEARKAGKRVTDKPEDIVYDNWPTTIPASQMTLGQVTGELQPTLIKETRENPKYKIYNKKGNKVGTSAVGIGQFLKSTLEDLAPKVFGEDWQNVVFTRENQEKLLRARYDQALNSKQVPGVVWEGLEKKYGGKKGFEWVRESGGFKKGPSYEEVRKLILETESKYDGPASSSEQKPKKSYSEELPAVLEGYFSVAERLQNGERSDALTSFINAGRSNKSALDILNEYAKANVNLKYGKDDSENTFPFKPSQFHTLVNSTREKLAQEGISVKPAQVAHIILNSAQLEQGTLWGRGDKIKMNEKALLNQVRELAKLSSDPEKLLTERIHNEYISVAPLVERFQRLNGEIAKMESRTTQNAGTKRQLDKIKQMREELAKQVTEQLHKLQGSWGLAKLSNQGY